MESIQVFSLFILSMGAFHLVSTAGMHLATWWNKNVFRKSTPEQLRAANQVQRTGASQESPIPQRDDWYVFFHCSDVTGREPLQKNNPRKQPQPDRKEKPKASSRRLTVSR